jgi:hypothetical protein
LEKRVLTYVILVFLVWAVSGTTIAGYYFTQYTTYRDEYRNLLSDLNKLSNTIGNLSNVINPLALHVNVLLSYGNGTRTWFNGTALPIGSTAFTAILAVSEVEYRDYGGTMGILVTSINGLAGESMTHGWFYWYRDMQNSTWVSPSYSCSQYILHRGDTVAFSYESYDPWPTSPS